MNSEENKLSTLEILQNCLTPLGKSMIENQDPWKFHMIFLEHPWKFHFSFNWPLEFPHGFSSIPLEIPCLQSSILPKYILVKLSSFISSIFNKSSQWTEKIKILLIKFRPVSFINISFIAWDFANYYGNYYKLRQMIGNGGCQITQ